MLKEIKIIGESSLLEKVFNILNKNLVCLDGAIDDFYYSESEEGKEGEIHVQLYS